MIDPRKESRKNAVAVIISGLYSASPQGAFSSLSGLGMRDALIGLILALEALEENK